MPITTRRNVDKFLIPDFKLKTKVKKKKTFNGVISLGYKTEKCIYRNVYIEM
jgi:hypothetical protein